MTYDERVRASQDAAYRLVRRHIYVEELGMISRLNVHTIEALAEFFVITLEERPEEDFRRIVDGTMEHIVKGGELLKNQARLADVEIEFDSFASFLVEQIGPGAPQFLQECVLERYQRPTRREVILVPRNPDPRGH